MHSEKNGFSFIMAVGPKKLAFALKLMALPDSGGCNAASPLPSPLARMPMLNALNAHV